jgi:PAS domain-containing protein
MILPAGGGCAPPHSYAMDAAFVLFGPGSAGLADVVERRAGGAGNTGQLRVAIRRADGTERVAELTPVQITLGGRDIFTGFLRDLTEIERSHAELADQTERLNCLIASAIPGVLITDEQGGRPLSDDLRRGNLRAWLLKSREPG